MFNWLRFALIAVVLTFVCAAPSVGATRFYRVDVFADDAVTFNCVPGPAFQGCSLRGAILLANGALPGDVNYIVLPPGQYELTQGELFVTGNIQLIGSASVSADATVIRQTTPRSRVFNLNPTQNVGYTAEIENLTITGGDNPADRLGGGAILLRGTTSSLELKDVVFAENRTSGGIAPQIDNALGGAIEFRGAALSVDRCEFRDNFAENNVAGDDLGGAIHFASASAGAIFSVSKTSFTGNRAGFGGAIAIDSDVSPVFRYNRFASNAGVSAGDAIYRKPGSGGTTDASFNWWACNAGPGNAGCQTIGGDTSNITSAPRLRLRHFPDDSSIPFGSAVGTTASFDRDSNGDPVAAANLYCFNDVGVSFAAILGTALIPGNTLPPDGTTFSVFSADSTTGNGGLNATVDNETQFTAIRIDKNSSSIAIVADSPNPSVAGQTIVVGVNVAPPGNVGVFPTGSVTISDGAATCNAPLDASGYGQCLLTLSNVGLRRITATYGGSAQFLGSSTSRSHTVKPNCTPRTETVTSPADSGNGSLRGTIAAACPESTIVFAEDVTGAISLTSGELVLNKNLKIIGPGAAVLTIRRDNAAGDSRVFHISSGAGLPATVIVSGLTIANGRVANNIGGGILVDPDNTLTLADCVVSGNSATGASGRGGGIGVLGTMNLAGSTVNGNTSVGAGGGILSDSTFGGGTASITNSTIHGNSATSPTSGSGGGFFNTGGATLFNVTIAGNSAAATGPTSGGGGVYHGAGSFVASNTIFALNSASNGPDFNGTLTNGDRNLVGNSAGSSGWDQNDRIDVSSGLDVDGTGFPRLANNGGNMPTIALLNGSAAIDAGTSIGAPLADQRGLSRPQNGTIDIGAVEFSVSGCGPIVTNTNDDGPGSLRCAVQSAFSGETITFAIQRPDPNCPSTLCTVTLNSGEILISKSLTIDGGGAEGLSVARSLAGGTPQFRVFHIKLPSPGGRVRLIGMRIENGSVSGAGGGVLNENATAVELNATIVTGNTSSSGGGIDTLAGDFDVVSSEISNNSAGNGGGIRLTGGRLSLTNSTVRDNSVGLAGTGGGIHAASGSLSIFRSTVNQNSAMVGGGVFNDVADVFLINSTLSGNIAQNIGGGIFHTGGPQFRIINSTIAGNSTSSGSAGGLASSAGVLIENSVIALNSAATVPDIDGAVGSDGFNLIGNTAGNAGWIASDLQNVAPGLETDVFGRPVLADNGGTTLTIKLLNSSPAIDGGHAAGNPLTASAITTDQRGSQRPRNLPVVTDAVDGDGSDIGAYEAGCSSLMFVETTLARGETGQSYNFVLAADGGTGPYLFQRTEGRLPIGITLSPNGTMSGVPTEAGAFDFVVTAYEANGCSISTNMTLYVGPWFWNGGSNNNWNNGTNWLQGIAPTATDSVIVSSAAPRAPLLSTQNATVATLTVEPQQSLSIGGGRTLTVNGELLLNGLDIDATGGTLVVGPGGTVLQNSGAVTGEVRKDFGGPGSFTFPVGTNGEYSPVSVNVTSGSGSLTVRATKSTRSPLNPATSLGRFWTLSGSGLTADLTFNYLDGDVFGDENNYKVIKIDSAINVLPHNPPGVVIDPANNQATINGVSSFSDWTLAQFVPTAADAVINGRVTTADGRGLRNAIVTITDDNGMVRSDRTGAFGYFRFDGIEVGRTYTIQVNAKRSRFAPQVLNVTDNVTDIVFVGGEQ